MASGLPQGTGYTNLSQIIQANQNNQLGNTVQSGVNKNISGLQNNVNQAQQQFGNSANAANTNTQANQQFVSNTINGITGQPNNPPANVNAPQGQTAPTSGSAGNYQSTAPTTPQQGTNSVTSGAGNFPAMTNVMASANTSGSSGSTTTPAPANTPTTPPPVQTAVPGSFGYLSSYASNPTGGSASFNTTNQAPVSAPQGAASQFSNFLQGGYTGPTQLNNISALQAQGQNLQAQGQNLGTQGGLQSLLQNYVGGPKYNQGEQTLDTILLGATAKPQLQNIAQSLQNVQNIPNQAEAQAQAQAQQIALGNQGFAQNVQNQLAAAQSPILGNIESNLGTLNTQNQANQSVGQQIYNLLNTTPTTSGTISNGTSTGIPNRIGGGEATPTTDVGAANQALKLAGQNGLVDPATLTQIQQILATQPQTGNMDTKELLQQAFNFNPTNPQYSLQQGATAQQAAQLNALEQLAGGQQQFNTYGGATAQTPYFDISKLPALAPKPKAVAPVPEKLPTDILPTFPGNDAIFT